RRHIVWSFPTRRSSDLFTIFFYLQLCPDEAYKVIFITGFLRFNFFNITQYRIPLFFCKPVSINSTISIFQKITADILLYKSAVKRISRMCSAKARSEEHTSELQSRFDLVCRLL